MESQIQVGEMSVDLIFKNIKNIHLSVYPPTGRVRISAPSQTNIETIRAFAISKISWIRKHQIKLNSQERQTPRELLDRESHFVWGDRKLLDIQYSEKKPSVELAHKNLVLNLKRHSNFEFRQKLLEEFYRDQLKSAIPELQRKWEKILGIEINQVFIQKMKTQWGSCNSQKRNIRINLELAKKPFECLEYIFLHEALHFFVPNHGERFVKLIDQHMSNWRQVRRVLNDEPLSHTDWKY